MLAATAADSHKLAATEPAENRTDPCLAARTPPGAPAVGASAAVAAATTSYTARRATAEPLAAGWARRTVPPTTSGADHHLAVTVGVGVAVATALLASSCLAAMARAVAPGMSSSSTTEEPVR